MVAFQPDPSLTYFKNLFCPISVVYFVTSSVAAETKQGWGSSSGGTRKFVLEIPYVNYNFKVLLLVVKFTVFERKCTLFLCELPTASKNPNFSCLNYYIYIYMVGFFSFFLALLCCWCSPCSAVLQLTGLAWSGALMWWCSELFLSPFLHCVSLTAVIMLGVIIRELLLYVLCSQQLWLVRLSENTSFLENGCLGHLFFESNLTVLVMRSCLF